MKNQIRCQQCGSENVNVQVMQENTGNTTVTKTKATYKQKKHGLLWWLFIGWWFWIIDIFLWIFLFPFRAIYAIVRKKKYVKKETSVSTGKNQMVYRKICTCQRCGYAWIETVK